MTRFLMYVVATVAVAALIWFGAPAVLGEQPPPPLIVLIAVLGLVIGIIDARRSSPRPPSGDGRP